jgi:hypothetical protein
LQHFLPKSHVCCSIRLGWSSFSLLRSPKWLQPSQSPRASSRAQGSQPKCRSQTSKTPSRGFAEPPPIGNMTVETTQPAICNGFSEKICRKAPGFLRNISFRLPWSCIQPILVIDEAAKTPPPRQRAIAFGTDLLQIDPFSWPNFFWSTKHHKIWLS